MNNKNEKENNDIRNYNELKEDLNEIFNDMYETYSKKIVNKIVNPDDKDLKKLFKSIL